MVEIGSNNARMNLVVHQDTVSGVNLEVVTKGFTYAPDKAGADHRPGEGHGHLYVDGEKIARLYGPWYHLGGLAEGSHDVTVTLNANDHRLLSSGGDTAQGQCDCHHRLKLSADNWNFRRSPAPQPFRRTIADDDIFLCHHNAAAINGNARLKRDDHIGGDDRVIPRRQ